MNKKILGALLAGSMLGGCATAPDEIRTASVSPLKYKDYSCDQIVQEMSYTSEETNRLYTALDKKASDDSVAMGVGMVLFWPALFFLEGGDGPEAAEYSQLKGEYKALRKSAVLKNCDATAFPKSPEQLIQEKRSAEKASAETSTADI